MAILLYRKLESLDGQEKLERYKQIPFGGNRNGVIYNYLSSKGILAKSPTKPNYPEFLGARPYIPWEASAKDVIKTAGYDPREFRLIIDLKPSVQNNVSLFEIRYIWGVTYPNWTPLMLKLRTLFIDVSVDKASAKECKKQILIDADEEKDAPIFDFIYLQGGYETGSWNPARLGFHSGLLMWPETAEFFSNTMKAQLADWRPSTEEPEHELLC